MSHRICLSLILMSLASGGVAHSEPRSAEELAAALVPGGVLLIRDADAAAGWRFTATRLSDAID